MDHKPSQMKLAGFTDEQAEEIEGVLEHYKGVEEAGKKRMRQVKIDEESKIQKAAGEVVALLKKYNRQAVSINGWTGQIIEKGVKVEVKRGRKPKAQRAQSPKKAGKA